MSGEKGSGPCGKFQANFFNQTKCQNCFKSRELHLLGERDLEQVKPVYAGWLCLAPEGTDFDNPMQRSRKWQRRFFVLYEDGSLSFALDELPSTLPQGTVSVTLCTDILDAESRTGQRNALCLATAQQDVFIRGDSRDIINGWSEQLAAFLPTDGRSEKKPKVEPGACQEPTSAKTSPTGSGFLSSHHDDQDRGQDGTLVWTVSGPRGAAPGIAETTGPKDSSGSRNRSSSAERMLGRKAAGIEQGGVGRDSRKGRSQARSGSREKLQSSGDVIRLSAAPPQRRSKSLDRRTSDSIVTPDLLNFKKGWMVKLDEDNQWKKSWFVLNADSLRYYKDSVAEEASDLEGEIDLTRCFSVAEFHVQRNYGFQIHTQAGVFTLSAMTAGIRKNWIQALMKNVHPANGPDVASLPGHLASSRTPEVLPKPDVTPDSSSSAPRPCGVADRRQKGRYQTFDWVEFRPPPPDSPGSPERRRRREERRRRYEDMLGFSLGGRGGGGGGGGGVEPLRVEEEVEECWRLVEKLMCRPEKMLPLISETETPLCGCRRAVEELTEQLEESERHRLKLEARLGSRQQQLDRRPPSPPSPPQPPRIWLQDSDGNLQQLEETPLPSPAAGGGNVELCGAEPDASEQAEVQRLSREVELLNQRNQEMLNQLTEADREIERLKAELAGRYAEPRLLPEAEQLEKRQVEEDQEPPEARAEPPCPEATEAKVTELEARLRQSEEAEEIHRRRAAEAEAEVRRLSRELEEERGRGRSRPHEDVTEATEVTAPSDDQSPSPLSQLKQEERFWSLLLRKLTELKEPAPPTSSASFLLSAAMDALTCCRTLELQAGPQRQGPAASDASCQTEEVEDLKGDEQEDLMENEKEDLKGDKMGDLQEEHQEDLKEDLKGDENQQENLQEDLQDQVEHQEDLEENHQVEHQEDLEENHQVEHQEDLEEDHQVEHQEDLKENHQVEDLEENHQVEDLEENHQVEDLEENHQVEDQEDLEENHQVEDLEENHQVEDQEDLEENHQVEHQEDLEEDHQVEHQEDLEENHQVEHQEDLKENHQVEHQEDLKDLEEDLQEDGPDLSFVEIRLDLEEDAEPDARVLVWALTERLQELQEQLRRQQQESQEELLRVGKEHRDQTDQLKAMCERGFSSMEEAQLKAVEELQRRHQQELQRLLLERDRLLEEESAATATAIEAIKNAHRLELQREVQRNRTRSLTESGGDGGGGGASHLEDVYRQHRFH